MSNVFLCSWLSFLSVEGNQASKSYRWSLCQARKAQGFFTNILISIVTKLISPVHLETSICNDPASKVFKCHLLEADFWCLGFDEASLISCRLGFWSTAICISTSPCIGRLDASTLIYIRDCPITTDMLFGCVFGSDTILMLHSIQSGRKRKKHNGANGALRSRD